MEFRGFQENKYVSIYHIFSTFRSNEHGIDPGQSTRNAVLLFDKGLCKLWVFPKELGHKPWLGSGSARARLGLGSGMRFHAIPRDF